MRKIIYLVFVCAITFISCGDDDKLTTEKKISYIDMSDFVVFKGSPLGAEEVVYNDLKNRVLASYFFKTSYDPALYNQFTIDFYQNRITYIFREGSSNRKIVSTYEFKDGKLYVLNADTLKFVAYGDSPDNLYMQKSIARYPLPGEGKDTIQTFDVTIGTDTILKLAGYQSMEDLKSESDTIVWCNIKYLFN